ncbi:MAG TPA: cytochrome C oxidase subunit IV family protein [Aggregatilineales bacterium]|nr:cytochrome C oxidase subunit IV family protein [Anaerolineales bacterium]HRE48612.1 cytochrome C oxidase subunit IV family protein [Aggregatilineales bacterium]
MEHTTQSDHADHTHNERHASEGTYFVIFGALAALTIAELLVIYLPGLRYPLLIGLMFTKAWLVVEYFMHLRYDNKLFRIAFLLPIVAGALMTILLTPLSIHP